MKTRLLFICSRNQWRSPTAESLFKNHPRYIARSAGTSPGARIHVTARHLAWADIVFCMEHSHAEHLRDDFRDELVHKSVIVLDIPDDYAFMDPILLALLRAELAAHLTL